MDPGSIRQKIFAFQSCEDDRFFVPTHSYLHMVFTPRSDTVQERGGCVVTYEELKRTLDHEISGYIHLRATQQHNAYRWRLNANPCLIMVTRGECLKQDCHFQHIRPEMVTASWFNARIRSVLMEIRILNLASFRFNGIFTCVLLLAVTTQNSDFVRTDIGLASFTLSCIPRHRSSALSPHSISGIRLNRKKGSGFCKNGPGGRVTSSCSALALRRSSISKPSSPTLCLSARWRTTSILSGHEATSPVRGCIDTTSGPRALFDQG